VDSSSKLTEPPNAPLTVPALFVKPPAPAVEYPVNCVAPPDAPLTAER